MRELVHETVELGEGRGRRPGAARRVDDHRGAVAEVLRVLRDGVEWSVHVVVPSVPVRERSQRPLPARDRARRTYARPMGRAFAVRGIVEGFYGTPWSHAARLDAISFLAPRGLNAYVYAPKDDAKHRADWRVPYDADERARFGELAAHAGAHDARFGFAISPGLDVDYESDADRAAILAKLEPLLDAGVPWFLLLLDDIPMQPGLAPRQAELATWLFERLRAARADASLTLCPTEYVGTRPSPYLGELGAGLPAEVDVMWTGPTVCSPTLRADDARGWTEALGGHRTIVWDNTPVNDATMTHELHLGPYLGRDAGPRRRRRRRALQPDDAGAGVAAPARDRDGVPARSRRLRRRRPRGPAPAADLGGDRADLLAVLARACADGPLVGPRPARADAAGRPARGGARRARLGRTRRRRWPPSSGRPARCRRRSRRRRRPRRRDRAVGRGGRARGVGRAGRAAPDPAGHARSSGPAATRRSWPRSPSRPCITPSQSPIHGWPRVPMNTLCTDRVSPSTRPSSSSPTGPGRPSTCRRPLREDANVIDRLCRLALDTYEAWRRVAGSGASSPRPGRCRSAIAVLRDHEPITTDAICDP